MHAVKLSPFPSLDSYYDLCSSSELGGHGFCYRNLSRHDYGSV